MYHGICWTQRDCRGERKCRYTLCQRRWEGTVHWDRRKSQTSEMHDCRGIPFPALSLFTLVINATGFFLAGQVIRMKILLVWEITFRLTIILLCKCLWSESQVSPVSWNWSEDWWTGRAWLLLVCSWQFCVGRVAVLTQGAELSDAVEVASCESSSELVTLLGRMCQDLQDNFSRCSLWWQLFWTAT
jgi:hypothetical protein